MSDDDLSGAVLDGRYQILEVLAEGGFGKVYVARQLNIDRKVAIKVMRREARASEDLVLRFEAEAKIISELRHPNTLKLFDYGKTDEGTLYLVTELLSGRPLSALLAEGPLQEAAALEILREVCLSLDEAHAQGIVHRDLKPANIFLEKVGGQEVVKVLDFGVAKVNPNEALASPGTPNTVAGTIVGTPAYMSPEAVDARPIGAKSDLYSLGVVAYECLTGRLPFVGSPIAQIAGHGFDRPKRPSTLAGAPALDRRVEDLVMRLLEKDPDARAASAHALADELERLMDALAAPAPERRRIGPILIGLGAALAGGVLLAALAFPPEHPAAPDASTPDAEALAALDPPDSGLADRLDAGLDLGGDDVRATPEVEGWSDPDAALSVLRDLAPVLVDCYRLIDADPRPPVTITFSALHSGTTVSVEPESEDSTKVRACFAFRRGRPIVWPGRGRATLRLAPRDAGAADGD